MGTYPASICNAVTQLANSSNRSSLLQPKHALTLHASSANPMPTTIPVKTGDDVNFETFSTKAQPWKSVWPAPADASDKTRGFGFKPGEVMVFDGNAGNFFPHGEWKLEQESSKK